MNTTLILALIEIPNLVAAVIFIGVTAVTFAVIGLLSGDDKPRAEARLEKMRHRRQGIEPKELNRKEAIAAVLDKATAPLADAVTGTEAEMGKLRQTLVNAGFRSEKAPVMFKGLQLIVTAIGFFVGGVYGLAADGLSQGLIIKAGLGIVAGFMLPSMALGHLAKKRREKIFLGLPDALDLMVVCVEAGLGMDQALRKVADEMIKCHPEIGEEFGIANKQLQFGQTRSEVLHALGQRTGVDDLKQLVSILIQADKFGSSVATALRVQSDSMRTKRRQIAEEKAAKTAVKMIFPLVLFIFPGIFVVLVGPAGISMYHNLM
jgi:tight adherence protein C